eukprot:3571032-Pleurochrysis_carterae.AAC.1
MSTRAGESCGSVDSEDVDSAGTTPGGAMCTDGAGGRTAPIREGWRDEEKTTFLVGVSTEARVDSDRAARNPRGTGHRDVGERRRMRGDVNSKGAVSNAAPTAASRASSNLMIERTAVMATSSSA